MVSTLEFSVTLAGLRALENEADRNQIIGLLRQEIGATTRRYQQRGADVLSLVRSCLQYPGCLDHLIEVLQVIEGDSTRMREVLALRRRLNQ